MQQTLILKRKLDQARFIHLLSMYLLAMLFFLCSNLPNAWWILVMTLAISASIEPGLMIGQSIQRSKGSFLSLLLLPAMLYALQINYRFIPVVFIMALIAFNVTSLNMKRYDISVFFNTIIIILLLAQTIYYNSPEGPIEAVINRALSIVIAIMIVIFGDYFLFRSYRYSQKLYLLHQRLIYELFNAIVTEVCHANQEGKNAFILLNKLRLKVNETFQLMTGSASNLKLDLTMGPHVKQQVDDFEQRIWELRRVTFALCFSELVLKSAATSAIHLAHYETLIKELPNHFITIKK